MVIHPLITDSRSLADLCARLAQSPYVAVDTEFMRENTYWPVLCLIQIADSKEAAAIDPMAPGIDMTPLLDLMVENHDVLKIFHAGGQDLEIVHNLTGKTPYPLFDTQIAAMALGMGEQVGYQNLVESWMGVKLDKGARFTDWARRPLDKRQIDYAIGDVTYLVQIFPKLLEKLKRTGRGDWLDQEMERLGDPSSYVNEPEQAWQRVKVPSRKPDVLGRLAREVRERVLAAPDWAGRFAVLEEFLARRVRAAQAPGRPVPRPEVSYAWDRLQQSYGTVSVADLAAETGWSARHLGEQFRAETGLSPKAGARVVRFDRARRRMMRQAAGGRVVLAELAAECGYYDQAHLARDFRDLAGCPPSALLAEEFRNVQAAPSLLLADSRS